MAPPTGPPTGSPIAAAVGSLSSQPSLSSLSSLSDCKFCAIATRDAPAHRVLEDETCVAFLDARPLFQGHVLVVPRMHRETIADLTNDELAAIFGDTQRLCRAIERALGAEGTFVAMNNRVSQSVPHAHVHVVPRRKGDGLRGFFWPRQKYATDAEAAEIAAQLRAAVGT